MKNKRLWEVLIEKGIKETSELARAIRSIRNDKRLSLREKDGEEWQQPYNSQTIMDIFK